MYLFITSTTYGTWLPGDERGFVSPVKGVLHNQYGTPIDADISWLKRYSQQKLQGSPILLNQEQSRILFAQFQDSTERRHWQILGIAIMPNHFHLLLELPDDISPEKAAGILKSYGSRGLNEVYGKPESGTWWTQGSSLRRKTPDAIPSVIRYIKEQHNALLVWFEPRFDVE